MKEQQHHIHVELMHLKQQKLQKYKLMRIIEMLVIVIFQLFLEIDHVEIIVHILIHQKK